jgi:ethanolamine ammonia-lyase large subunit
MGLSWCFYSYLTSLEVLIVAKEKRKVARAAGVANSNSPNFVQNESVLNEIVLSGGFGVLAGLGVGPP